MFEQESGTHENLAACDATPSGPSLLEDCCVAPVVMPGGSSPSGGLAFTIAAMVEHQHMSENSTSAFGNMPESDMLPHSSGLSIRDERSAENYPPERSFEVLSGSRSAAPRDENEWALGHGSEMVEAGTSYASLDTAVNASATVELNEGVGDVLQPPMAGPILPESFEEQMMLAVARSLAEARARSSSQGLAQQ